MRLSSFIAAFVVAGLPLVAAQAAATDSAPVLAVVKHWKDSFNKGDIKAAVASCAADAIVIDEVPPFSWRGEAACQHWVDAVGASFQQDKISNVVMSTGKPWRATVVGDNAYFVAPAKLKFLADGKPGTETGSVITISLEKVSGEWKISGIAWSAHN